MCQMFNNYDNDERSVSIKIKADLIILISPRED